MKKIFSLVMALVMALSLVACGDKAEPGAENTGTESPYTKIELKCTAVSTEQGIDTLAAFHLAELLDEATDGVVKLEVFPNASLAGGSMAKCAEMLSAGGTFDMVPASGSTLSNLDNKFLVHQIPFIFGSYADVDDFLDGTGTEAYANLAAEKNIFLTGGFYNGLRQLTTGSKQVTKPEDLKNMKIRIPSGEVYMKTLAEFGCDPVAMAWSEVFTALQQNALDGHENGYQMIASNNIQEVQDYILEWNWSFDGFWFCWNADTWNKLNAATQELIVEKCAEASMWARENTLNAEAEIKQEFIDKGIVITVPTADELNAFKEIAAPAQEYFIDYYGEELCAAWGLSK